MESTQNTQEKQYKLLLIGEQAVGKSSLLNRYVDNVFEVNIMGTAGLDLKKKIIEIKGEKIKIWLCCGNWNKLYNNYSGSSCVSWVYFYQ